jgi:DNA replication protein DnaD
MIIKRNTSKKELDEITNYWISLPRGSNYLNEASLIRFLEVFTPDQIKGAMYVAKSTGRQAYFRYLCGILNNWLKALENGEEPRYFDISE